MTDRPDDELVAEWLLRAEDDEANCQSILRHRDGTPSGVCFLAQQMAEKLLKALLLKKVDSYPRVHDLIELGNMLDSPIPGTAEQLKEDLILLRPYYVATRYPADIALEEFTWDMAEEAMEAADRIKRFVLAQVR